MINQNSTDSQAIGEYYARKKGLPSENIFRARTGSQQSISRHRFEEEIFKPLAEYLASRQLQDRILYIVTTKGVPLVVEGNAGPLGDLASVDSELSLLYRYLVFGSYPTHGKVENPYFAVQFDPRRTRPFNRREHDIYLVTRLTGASLVDALFLADRSSASGSKGRFYIDLPSQRSSLQAEWLGEASRLLEEMGFVVRVEDTRDPLRGAESVLGYCAWSAAVEREIPSDWVPGALSLAIDDWTPTRGASTPGSALGEDLLAFPFQIIQSGATGFGGHIANPTLDGVFRPQILFPAYVSGYNLAESFFASIRYVGWRQLVIGDPLASPFAAGAGIDRQRASTNPDCRLDPETGLPECFAERRRQFLAQQHSLAKESLTGLLRAEALWTQGRLPQALQAVEDTLLKAPHVPDAHRLKAALLERQGELEQAFHHLQRAFELGDRTAEMYRKLALLALRELDDAAKAAPFASWLYRRLGSQDLEVACLWAEVQRRQGDLDRAKAIYLRLVQEQDPAPRPALKALGSIHFEEGEWELAEDFLKRAQQIPVGESAPSTVLIGTNGHPVDEVEQMLQEIADRRQPPSAPDDAPRPQAAPLDALQRRVRPAAVLHKVQARYPQQAQRQGIQGRVVLELLIDERGQMLKAKVVSGHPLLVKAAIQAVEQWKFQPRLVNGRAEPSLLPVVLAFTIKKSGSPEGDFEAVRL